MKSSKPLRSELEERPEPGETSNEASELGCLLVLTPSRPQPPISLGCPPPDSGSKANSRAKCYPRENRCKN